MKTYVVIYSLNAPDKDYYYLYQELRSYEHLRSFKSTWFIRTERSLESLYNRLDPILDEDDHLIIFPLAEAYKAKLSQDDQDWLNKNR